MPENDLRRTLPDGCIKPNFTGSAAEWRDKISLTRLPLSLTDSGLESIAGNHLAHTLKSGRRATLRW
jgi:hypothetical protein